MAKQFDDNLFEDQPYDENLFENQPYDENLFEDQPESRMGEAFLEGAKQGATFGMSDELGGRQQQLMDLLTRYTSGITGIKSPTQVSEELAAQGIGGDIGPTSSSDLYEQAVSEDRARLKELSEAEPGAYMAGELAGGFVTPMPGGGVLKAGGKALKDSKKLAELASKYKTLSAAKKGLTAGAATGALEAAGRTEADLTSAEGLIDVGTGMALGGVLGAGTGKLLGKMGKGQAAEKATQLQQEAEEEILGAMGASKKMVKKEMGMGPKYKVDPITGEKVPTKISESKKGIGKDILEENVIKVGRTPEESIDLLTTKIDDISSQKDQLLRNAQKQLDEMNLGQEQIQQIREDLGTLVDDSLGVTIGEQAKEAMQIKLTDIANDISNRINANPNNFDNLIKVRQIIGKQIKEGDWTNPDRIPVKDFYIKAYNKLNQHIEELANKASPEIGTEVRGLDKKISNLIDASNIMQEDLTKEISKGGLAVGDYIAMTAGGSLGGAVLGLPGMVAAVPVLLAKKGLEKKTGKDVPRMLKTWSALRKAKKAGQLREQIPTMAKEATGEIPATIATAQAAALADSKEYSPSVKEIANMSQDELTQLASMARDSKTKEGNLLAERLQSMQDMTPTEKTKTIFSLKSQPAFSTLLNKLGK